ncbi:MAG: hypothetical protein ACM3OO_12290 [Planctomycetaceae bacterium]
MSETEPRNETGVRDPEADAPEAGAAVEAGHPPPARRPHGWVSLYLAAFVLLLVSGLSVALAARNLLQSLGPLYLSIALSVVAAILAVVAVLLPKRG